MFFEASTKTTHIREADLFNNPAQAVTGILQPPKALRHPNCRPILACSRGQTRIKQPIDLPQV